MGTADVNTRYILDAQMWLLSLIPHHRPQRITRIVMID